MVLDAVRRSGSASRTGIAAATALSHSTISAIASDLIDEGILAEVRGGETAAMRRGRPQVAIGLAPQAATIVTIVLALNSVQAAAIDYAGVVMAEQQKRPFTQSLGRDELVAEVTQSVRRLLRDPARYHDDFIAILLSHGIGMGIMLKGKLFTGTQSSGSEFGHMIHRPDGALCRCGRRGCVEAYAGSYAIWRNARQASDAEEPVADISDAEMFALAAQARLEDGPERQAFRIAGEAIGFGLGSLFALIDAAPVAFVGYGASAFDLIEPAMRKAIARTAGGQHSKAPSFDTIPDEMPLIRNGCAIRALAFVDHEIFAPGAPVQVGKEVA